ncbi:secretory calcium-binding phosphoprotein 5 [Brachyhypopomus gauderio]|uniref:secretory calcium-binding phosphoprotein 5 n=1 Tax=Brachyhypopomus gauderio TaxID=698409 RepID=UPI0040410041
MWSSILCLSFVTAVSAAPMSPFLNYLPHYGNPVPSGPSTQGNTDFFPAVPSHLQPSINSPISMEIVFPPSFPGSPAGGAGSGHVFPSQAFIKYSLPKAPGRKSVEIYYPYDFRQGQILPFDYSPQTVPQQQPPRATPPQFSEVQQQIQQDQQVQAGQP